MSKLKQVFGIIFAKKNPLKVAAAVESIRVKALNRQVETLNEMNEAYVTQIKALVKQVTTQQTGNFQERMIDMAANFILKPKGVSAHSAGSPLLANTQGLAQASTLESGLEYSDNDLIQLAQSLPTDTLKQLGGLDLANFSKAIKSQIPKISETSVKRAMEIVGTMV